MELNLTAQNKQEELVLKYLQDNASETLADKINNGTPFEKDGKPLLNKKTLAGFMKYACDEARKLAEKGANSACIDDATVYGWAIHYFEEESIEGTLYTIDGAEYKPTVKRVGSNAVKAKPEPEKFVLRASACGRPKTGSEQINGTTYKTITVEDKTYIPQQ